MTARPVPPVVEFLALVGFWFALSGRFEPVFVVLGVLTAAVVTLLSRRLAPPAPTGGTAELSAGELLRLVPRAVGFALWLAGRAVAAGVQVAWLAVVPHARLSPCVLRFDTELSTPTARTALTNAISIVPGTLTVDLDGARVVVHALSPAAVEDLTSGRLQNRVARLVGEGPQPPVDPASIDREGLS